PVQAEGYCARAVPRSMDEGRTRLLLNLADVPGMDSTGLGASGHAYASAWRRGGEPKRLHVRQRNRQLLTVTRLLTVFDVFDSEEEAVKSFGADPRERSAVSVA